MLRESAFKVLKKLNNNGFQAYIVGGYVRDSILNIDSNDIDITTNATPNEVKEIFDIKNSNGEKYLSVVVNQDEYSFEVTTFRKDISYSDHRHPVTEITNSLDEDLKRRDFTINALLMDANGKIYDYFQGLDDLKNKQIRSIGDPNIRFDEDSLRILRACHFTSKLGFDIEKNTFDAMLKNVKSIKSLSSERILDELNKIIKGKYYVKGLGYLNRCNASKYLKIDQAISLIIKKNLTPTLDDILALSLYYNKEISFNIENHKKKLFYRALELIGKDILLAINLYNNDIDTLILANRLNYYLSLSFVKEEMIINKKQNLPISSRKDVMISRDKIVDLVKKTDGPWLGQLYKELEINILNGYIKNDSIEIEEYIRRKFMANVEYFTYYGKIKGINTSDGMYNLLVTLPNQVDINVKTEEQNDNIKIGYIYKMKVGRHSNSEKEVYYLFECQKVSQIEDITEVDMVYRMFDSSCPYSLDELKSKIYGYADLIENSNIKAITLEALKQYERLFFIYPAGQRLHHNYVGGLAHHTLGMLEIAQDFKRNFPYLDKDYLYSGVILHDLGKTLEFTGVENTEYSLEGQLLGHLVIGGLKIFDIAKGLGLEKTEEALILEHIVISHHGQQVFGACKKPQTAEAAAIWYIDTIDSKFRVLGQELEKIKAGEFTDTIGVMDKTKFYKLK